jgi:hypothetical protein
MRFHALLLLVSVAFAFPAAALAQTPTPPPPQPTPPPGWQAPEDEPPPPDDEPDSAAPVATPDPNLRAVDTLPPDMQRRDAFGKPGFAPTIAIAAGFRSVKNRPELATASFDLWAGLRFHPSVSSASPFMAMGAEVNFRTIPDLDPTVREGSDTGYTEVVPEMRFGFAHLRQPHHDYVNVLFPNVELYGIAGWRIANRYNGHGLRLGVGVSAPIFMALTAASGYPCPSMFELTMDTESAFTGEREFAFRLGWHF